MNDITIISIISKTYFAIVSFLSFIFLLLTFSFIIIQNGLYIEDISISKLNTKKVYIKWNKKIDVSIEELSISTKNSAKSQEFDYQVLKKYLQTVSQTTNWFDSIIIKKISLDDIKASFKYKHGEKGLLIASSPTLQLDTSLGLVANHFTMQINNFTDFKRNISLKGNVYVDIKDSTLFSKVNANIHDDANLTLYVKSTLLKMDYLVKSHKNITNIRDIINMFDLPKEVRYWALDAIEMSNVKISKVHGTIEYKDISSALEQVYVSATVNKLNYTYNPQLDAIHTQTTELEFKKGVLYIRPKQAYSYDMFLGKSWLKIDFTQEAELLTLYLLFDGMVNKDMLHILNTYKIKLPFLQKKGNITTNLTLAVNLRTIDIDAKGDFFTKKANFDYLGLNIDIFDAYIELDNFDASIKSMKASYKDIANATVTMKYNAKRREGDINFKFQKIDFKQLSLDTKKEPLSVTYSISTTQDTINTDNSHWNFGKKKIHLDTMHMPFDMKKLTLMVPTTYVELQDISSAFVSGAINIKSMKSKLSADVLSLSYDGLSLSQSNTPLDIVYDKKLSVTSMDPIYFNVSGTEYEIANLDVVFDTKNIYLKNSILNIGKFVSTKIYTKYNFKDKKAHVSLSGFTIKNYEQGNILYKKNKILLSVLFDKTGIKASSKELDSKFISNNQGWELSVNSLDRLSNNSKLLDKLHINNGELVLYKKNDEKYVKFNANLIYPYKILTKDSKPTNKYTISGKINKNKTYLNINNQAKVKIDKNIKITAKKTGINIAEIIRFIEDSDSSSSSENKKITIHAKDSYLYISDTRRVISEYIDLQYLSNILTAQLEYKNGNAGLRYEKKEFHIYGQNFNDNFMEKLFSLSKFKGGKLDFSISGAIDDYNGVFHIEKTTIIDYKILNNILAFINTVPSLLTFSLPDYNDNGLFVKKAYVNFNSKNNVFNLSDIYLGSKELTILGKGKADIIKDSIDINLNLKTDLGSNLSQMPVVGYIIFDKESISTTLEVTGKLTDPDIKSLIAQDIVIAPLNIIKRTLSLPLKLYDAVSGDSNETE